MPMMGNTDALKAKPKFPKERTQDGLVILSANAVASGTILSFPQGSTSVLANGYVANGYNIGITHGTVGFNLVGSVVTNITSNTVTLSSAVLGPIVAGQQITFSKPLNYKPNRLANTYNANTYLVTTGRMNNANSIVHNGVAHTGWNYVTQGSGYVKAISWKNAGNQSSNGFINFYSNSQYEQQSGGANASYTVDANGSLTSITINNGGTYNFTPFANVSSTANASVAVLNVVMGGRANRTQVETLAVLSGGVASDSTSGGNYFPGV